MFSKALVLAPLAVCIVSSVNAAPAEEKRQLDGGRYLYEILVFILLTRNNSKYP